MGVSLGSRKLLDFPPKKTMLDHLHFLSRYRSVVTSWKVYLRITILFRQSKGIYVGPSSQPTVLHFVVSSMKHSCFLVMTQFLFPNNAKPANYVGLLSDYQSLTSGHDVALQRTLPCSIERITFLGTSMRWGFSWSLFDVTWCCLTSNHIFCCLLFTCFSKWVST